MRNQPAGLSIRDAPPGHYHIAVASYGTDIWSILRHRPSRRGGSLRPDPIAERLGDRWRLMVRVHYDEGVAIHIGPEFMRGRS